eukprot:GFUD01016698.1.p1 GENE.GFUD01016698.1~~GFUD01016698.1.p1  ORF type:complete len:570 (-),score=154.09 GFUD01016698.1:142-1851(-)
MGRANTAKPDESDNSDKSKKGVEEAKQASKKAQYGCQLAPRLPHGVTLQDVRTLKWTLGKAIGSGGFGDIYLASRGDTCEDDSEYVVKLEPHDNGPLFTEMHCLLRLGLQQHRDDWKPRNGEVGWVAMPLCHGNGSIEFEGMKLRFVVIDRLGSDLDKFFAGGEKPWPVVTVLKVAMMVVDSLEFVHSKGYAHNDIKAQNLLQGLKDKDRVYLVDFGLACKYRDSHGFHKSDDPDERKAHDGTLEYTSRDAHTGAHSRRGDFETLGYNMVHWACGSLPWMGELEDPEKVEASKQAYMENLVGFLTKCFGQGEVYPPVLEEYLNYVNDMDFDSDPDYDAVREMFEKCILAMGKSVDSKMVWTKPKPKKKKQVKKADFAPEDESSRGVDSNIDEDSQTGERRRRSRRVIDADTEEKDDEGSSSIWNWESVLSKNPEKIMRKKKPVELSLKEADFERRQKESLTNPTPEMSRIIKEMEELELLREQMAEKDQLQEFNRQRVIELKARFQEELVPCEFTPAMQEIIDKRSEGCKPKKEISAVAATIKDELGFVTGKLEELALGKLRELTSKRR